MTVNYPPGIGHVSVNGSGIGGVSSSRLTKCHQKGLNSYILSLNTVDYLISREQIIITDVRGTQGGEGGTERVAGNLEDLNWGKRAARVPRVGNLDTC